MDRVWLGRSWLAGMLARSAHGRHGSRWWQLGPLLLGSLSACGGVAGSEPPGATDGNTSSGGTGGNGARASDATSSDGSGGTPSATTTSGVSQAGAGGGPTPDNPYIPTHPDLSPEGDGTLQQGSFEGNFGNGWDNCLSIHPEPEYENDGGTAAHGDGFAVFDSSAACPKCSQRTGDLQVMFEVTQPIPPETQHLYFDVVNLADTPPSGALTFGGVVAPIEPDDLCQSDATLSRVALADLALSSEWQTRCVSFTPEQSLDVLGLYVSDGSFRIGLDTLRFGPPCHE